MSRYAAGWGWGEAGKHSMLLETGQKKKKLHTGAFFSPEKKFKCY